MIDIIDFGISKYGEILDEQNRFFSQLVNSKKIGKRGREYIMIGEHFPVITLGRRAKETNVLLSEESLKQKGVDLFHVGRGGDVTYHCPGQLILYPILDLERHELSVKDYVFFLEETVIRLLDNYGIKGERVEGATGVWIDKGSEKERKISAIGVKCSRFCSMHGLSLNVVGNLDGFSMINPCGFIDKGITSIEREMRGGSSIAMKEIKKDLLQIFFSLIFPFEEVLYFPE